MADISGYYEFHRDCPAQPMTILAVDHGSLIDSSIENGAIHGIYTASTNAISFNDAPEPGEFFFVTFYSGFVMPDGTGSICAMAGTYHQLIWRPRPFSLETVQGGWYAIRTGDIIP